MTDRTVKVSLVAQVTGYLQGMEKARQKTKETADEAKNLGAQKEAFETVGRAALAMGVVAAAGVALAIKKFADFDAQMSQVQTLSHATADEMDQLTNASLNMGQAIGFSANQVADAEIELVKAGVGVKEMLGGALVGALNLAAAGQIDVAQATQIASVALTQFKLQGKDVPHVADLLAAGADKALGGVDQLGQALNQGGLVAAQFGLTVDETVGTLAAFANAGLLGSDAGTSFKTMLLSLASPSAKAKSTMDELGIAAYDANGAFVGITALAGQLHDKLKPLPAAQRDAALSIIFGTDAIRTSNVLMEQGAQGIQTWIDKVNDQGFAADQARGKMDNLAGDVRKLSAAFDTGLIKTGSTANDMLRGMVQGLTGLVAAFNDLPGPVQGSVLVIGGLVAAVGLLGGGALTIVPRIGQMQSALGTLGTSMKAVSLASGMVGVAIGALVFVVTAIATAQAKAKARVDEFTASLDEQTGAVTKNTRATALKQLQDSGALDMAKKLGLSLKLVTDAAVGQEAAQKKLGNQLDRISAAHQQNVGAMDGNVGANGEYQVSIDFLRASVSGTSAEIEKSKQILKDSKEALDTNATSSTTAADAYDAASIKVEDLNGEIVKLIDTVNKSNSVGQDAVKSNADYQKSLADADAWIDKARKGIEGYALGIDESTVAGSANVAMLANLAASNENAAAKQFALDGSTEKYKGTLEAGRQAIVDRAIALGATADQAQALADKIAAIPTEKSIQMLVDSTDAVRRVKELQAWIDGLHGKMVPIIVQAQGNTPGHFAGFAGGGTVPGGGGPKADTVLVRASSGEEIIQNPYASIYRNELKQINSGIFPRYASGGTVMMPSVRASSFATAPGTTGAAPAQFNVIVQSKGGVDLMKYVDVRVEQANTTRRVGLENGVQR